MCRRSETRGDDETGRQDGALHSPFFQHTRTMNISVIIPVHNGGDAFEACLRGLADAAPAPTEILIVPDGESDGSWRRAKAYGARILDPTPTPHGPAHARNRGAEAARGDILFFVDADVVIHPNAIERVRAVFQDDPDVDALIGSYDDTPGATSFLSQYRNLLHHYVHQTSDVEASTFWGACGAIKRAVFLEVGGFDEDYARPSIEDIELGYRLKRAGHRIRLCKTLQVKHLKHWSAASILKTDFLSRALPWTELILRDKAFINDLNLRHTSRFSVVAVYLLLAALVASFLWPEFLFLAATSAGALLVLNFPLYRFFYQKRGLLFALGTLPWHWLFYLYSGLAFALGITRHLLGIRRPKQGEAAPA